VLRPLGERLRRPAGHDDHRHRRVPDDPRRARPDEHALERSRRAGPGSQEAPSAQPIDSIAPAQSVPRPTTASPPTGGAGAARPPPGRRAGPARRPPPTRAPRRPRRGSRPRRSAACAGARRIRNDQTTAGPATGTASVRMKNDPRPDRRPDADHRELEEPDGTGEPASAVAVETGLGGHHHHRFAPEGLPQRRRHAISSVPGPTTIPGGEAERDPRDGRQASRAPARAAITTRSGDDSAVSLREREESVPAPSATPGGARR
jgi:hypothetical protein